MKCMNLLMCMVVFSAGFAREVAAPPVSKNLNEQYKTLSAECDLVDGFRVMKLYKMDQLWKSVQDSIHKKQADIQELQSSTSRLDKEIGILKASLNRSNMEQASLESAVDNLNVFGMEYSKTGFVVLMAIVLVALMVLAVILFLMYRVAFGNAREFRKLNESMQQEFDDFKHQTVEKQIKLSREMQNYRNKLEELKISKSY